MPWQLADLERLRKSDLMWNVVFFHTRDAGHRWAPSQRALELLKCFLRTLSNYFNRAVGEIAGSAAEP
jgi:hypothetical protein